MRPNLYPSLLSWLRCFDAVARNHSFTRAAQELHVTQSAVSQQVRQLEDRLGVLLFQRNRQEVSLTVEGRQLHKPVRNAFHLLEGAITEFDEVKKQDALQIVCAPSFSMRWLMPRMGRFFASHPQVPVSLRADFHTLVYGQRETGTGIASVIYEPSTDGSSALPLLDEWLFPVASPLFMSQHPELRSPTDLAPSMLLHDDMAWVGATQHAEWMCWMNAVGIHSFAFQEGNRFNLSMLAIEAALSGKGIAMGRSALVLDDIISGQLVNVFDINVLSPAMYVFDVSASTSPSIGLVTQWLTHEVEAFCRIRALHLHAP